MSRKLLALLVLVSACGMDDPTAGPLLKQENPAAPAPPAELVSVAGTTLWPYTGADLSGAPQDPVNLIFTGVTDPRVIRQALFALDGNRPPFGGDAPFNCTWQDAMGDEQAAWTEPSGWTGSAVQLACGPYGPLRFHLRLFPAGETVVANAHFEVLIPNTTEHQVLSWELAEQLVTYDLMRTGLLDPGQPVAPSGPINQAPAFRGIPAVIYNELGPLWAALGAPPTAVQDPMPIPNDGVAMVFAVASTLPVVADNRDERFTIMFNQAIPKPFCVGQGSGYVYVQGPVELRQQVRVTASGEYVRTFNASGRLQITPLDPTTGQPSGETYQAVVEEQHRARFDGVGVDVSSRKMLSETPPIGAARGRLTSWLRVGPVLDAGTEVRCGA